PVPDAFPRGLDGGQDQLQSQVEEVHIRDRNGHFPSHDCTFVQHAVEDLANRNSFAFLQLAELRREPVAAGCGLTMRHTVTRSLVSSSAIWVGMLTAYSTEAAGFWRSCRSRFKLREIPTSSSANPGNRNMRSYFRKRLKKAFSHSLMSSGSSNRRMRWPVEAQSRTKIS